jgi:hypothetical protein
MIGHDVELKKDLEKQVIHGLILEAGYYSDLETNKSRTTEKTLSGQAFQIPQPPGL